MPLVYREMIVLLNLLRCRCFLRLFPAEKSAGSGSVGSSNRFPRLRSGQFSGEGPFRECPVAFSPEGHVVRRRDGWSFCSPARIVTVCCAKPVKSPSGPGSSMSLLLAWATSHLDEYIELCFLSSRRRSGLVLACHVRNPRKSRACMHYRPRPLWRSWVVWL